MKNYLSIYFLTGQICVLLIAGCASVPKTQVKNEQRIPVKFSDGKTDTTNSFSLPVHDYFSDEHLVKLIDTALKNNQDVLSALQRVEVAENAFRLNRAVLLPSVNGSVSAGVEKYGDYTQNGVGNYDTNFSPNLNSNQLIPNPVPDYFIGFRSDWEIDLWGKLRNRKKATYARFLASKNGYRMITTSLVAQIATHYYELLHLDNELAVIRKNIKLQRNAAELMVIQKAGGRATELAVQQFYAQLYRTESLEGEVLQRRVDLVNNLLFLQGKFRGTIERDTSIIAQEMPRALNNGVPTQLLLNRPDVRAAELELQAMNADIRAARAAFLPSLTLTPYVGLNAFRSALLFNPGSFAYGILGGLSAPIFNQRRLKTDFRITVAEANQRLFEYQKSILNAFLEVESSLNGMGNFRNAFNKKQQEVDALRKALSVANDLYLVGRATYLEVITAQRSVLDAELELAGTKRNIYLNSINMYRALGGGWH
ncbi:MAG: efflux transporter outer membrane subunit [Mucilaginibacter polytrichastri]|nr:efflux transporter outer membrane subunit [Mucilaginibacter polytrichastri]